ncbi:unnamed protein product [Parnassius mnemosyne]|uniref:FXNA-like protease n=1 Tax=Parnassius mnemosyne TaxID=213953 RepID=A0AAV1KQT5_9NEOP
MGDAGEEMDDKEEKARRLGVSSRWVGGALVAAALLLLLAAQAERRLPPARDAPPDDFSGFRAHRYLTNLTAVGPRVAGSYENEVVTVKWIVNTLREIAAQASPHNRLELDVHTASGAFPLSFLDGMNNVYRDVQSVVARASGVGGRRARTALLLNCHFDTVPDSPGASDDGAGCAVLLETLRALLAAPRPLRHDVIALLNGAEENILQASHAFVTTHRWAKDVRAFINLEACGSGGREVLFQAGPHDPWILEVYAGAAPHPFASSLAQELFQSGLIPADTDFRIFRDFGGLSGVDLAWSSNGFVYHTRLDTAARVPPGALQRTGDNVLALVQGMLRHPALEHAVERSALPAYCDMLGLVVLALRPGAALLATAVALLALLLRLLLSAADAQHHLYMSRGAWWRAVRHGAVVAAASAACGVGAAAAAAALLHALRARLLFYARPPLLLPLYALPAVCGWWWAARAMWRRGGGGGGGAGAVVRGWWRARACGDAACALAGGALLCCAAAGLRSAFLPLLWTLPAAAADAAASLLRLAPRARAACWALGAALPAAQTCYLALASLDMFVPIMGRAGTTPLPPDVIMAVMVGALTITALSWVLPFVVAADNIDKLLWAMAGTWAASAALAVAVGAGAVGGHPAYSAARPQRVLLFHVRRTDHSARDAAPPDHLYWIPEIDANTPRSLYGIVKDMEKAQVTSAEECSRWVYCGAPYYLPVRSLVARGYSLPAPAAPRTRLHATLQLQRLQRSDANGTLHALHLHLHGDGARYVVCVVSPAAGARVSWSSAVARPLEAARWADRTTYFFALHHARPQPSWHLELHIQHNLEKEPEKLVDVSVAGHSLFGEDKLQEAHRRLLAALPAWTAPTGWGIDLHLYSL